MIKIKQEIRDWWNQNPCSPKDRYITHPWILRYFDEGRGKKMLEVGCGIGEDSFQFVLHGADITSLDISSISLKKAKMLFKRFGVKGKFKLGDAENLPFEDETFEFIYSYGVLHHTPNTHIAINEIYRVLKPKGKILIMLYNKNSFFNLMHNIQEMEGTNSPEEPCPIVQCFSKKEIKEMFSMFSEITITTENIGRLSRFLPNFINNNFGWFMIIRGLK